MPHRTMPHRTMPHTTIPDKQSQFLRSEKIWFRFMWGISLFVIWIFGSNIARADSDDDATAGSLLVKTDQSPYREAVRMDSELEIEVTGFVARASLKQIFKNDSQDWVEGKYVFPLPEKAAVDQLIMRVGERVIVGEIKEKHEAKKIYHRAKQQGKTASVIHQQRPNLFTAKVANIGPGETVIVEIAYQQTVNYDQGEFSLRFPMTLTPRYIPGRVNQESIISDDGWALNTDQVPDANAITPLMKRKAPHEESSGNRIAIEVQLEAGFILSEVKSLYHKVSISREGTRYLVSLVNGIVLMNRDFMMSWKPVIGHEPNAAFFMEEHQGDRYGLLMVMPPDPLSLRQNGSVQSKIQALAKDMIFVIDTSGSMVGDSIEQARQSLLLAIKNLKAGDYFNLIEFNSTANRLFATSVKATHANKNHALNFVSHLSANGGTEIMSALQLALGHDGVSGHVERGSQSNLVRQVVFITDGSVGNEEALFKTIKDNLHGARLFTVGIGSAPNSYFMARAAEFGRGTYTYIGDLSEVSKKMSELFRKIENPALTNIELRAHNDENVEMFPARIPDLYAGEPLIVVLKFNNSSDQITVSGRSASQQGAAKGVVKGVAKAGASGQLDYWQRHITLPMGVQQQNKPNGGSDDQASDDKIQDDKNKGIATLWANAKIKNLVNEQIAIGEKDRNKQAIIDIALQHHLVSRYTSLVAVEQKVSRPILAEGVSPDINSHSVRNVMPKGSGQTLPVSQPQSIRSITYPRTATMARTHYLMGLISLMLSVVLFIGWTMTRKREAMGVPS